MRRSILDRIGWLKPRGMSEEKAKQLAQEAEAGLYFTNLMKTEYWKAQESLEVQIRNEALEVLRKKEKLTEEERNFANIKAFMMESMATMRQAIIQKGTFAQDALNRYTKEKKDD